MSDLVITSANVSRTSGTVTTATSGGTLTAGMAVYIDTGDSNKIKAASCVTSTLTATVAGICLNNATANQPVSYLLTNGILNLGATLTVGETYVLSTAGLICPIADLASADRVTYIGYATTSSSLTANIKATGVTIP